MNESAHLLTSESCTIFHKGECYAVTNQHDHWAKIVAALDEGDYDKAVGLTNRTIAIEKEIVRQNLSERIKIDGDAVVVDEIRQGPAACKYIISLVENNHNLAPVIKFFENLSKNPSYRAREHAMNFVVQNDMPITQDGNFMAYKRVREDYTDVHSGTLSNTVGSLVLMPRNQVDDDPNRTCSAGLHVCSQAYLRSFHGPRLMAVVVNPANVVCVPTDYKNSKMRVAKYDVVSELPISLVADDEHAWKSQVVDDEYEDVVPESDEEESYSFAIIPADKLGSDGMPSHDYLQMAPSSDNINEAMDMAEDDDIVALVKLVDGTWNLVKRVG